MPAIPATLATPAVERIFTSPFKPTAQSSEYFKKIELSLSSPHPGLMRASEADSSPARTAMYVIREWDELRADVDLTSALLVIIRKVRVSDGFVICTICDCMRGNGLAALIWDDKPYQTAACLHDHFGGLSNMFGNCVHAQGVLRVLIRRVAQEKQYSFIDKQMPDHGICLSLHQTDPYVRRISSFELKCRGARGCQTWCPTVLGLRHGSLAIGFWNGSRILCLSCQSSKECGHFKRFKKIYESQGIFRLPAENLSEDTQLKYVRAKIVYPFDPGTGLFPIQILLKNLRNRKFTSLVRTNASTLQRRDRACWPGYVQVCRRTRISRELTHSMILPILDNCSLSIQQIQNLIAPLPVKSCILQFNRIEQQISSTSVSSSDASTTVEEMLFDACLRVK